MKNIRSGIKIRVTRIPARACRHPFTVITLELICVLIFFRVNKIQCGKFECKIIVTVQKLDSLSLKNFPAKSSVLPGKMRYVMYSEIGNYNRRDKCIFM